MKTIKYILTLITVMIMTVGDAWADGSLLDGKKWTKTSLSTNKPSGGFSAGGLQGAAVLDGDLYQFHGAGSQNSNIPNYDVYNISSGTWTNGASLNCIANSHTGSACFGTKVFTTSDGYTYNCTKPFVYLTEGNTIQIVDIENNNLVAKWTLPKLDDDAIAAYDFANGKLWSIGYVSGSRKAPYLIRELSGLDFNTLPTDRTVADNEFASKTSVGGPDGEGIQHDLQNGTIQDCQYVDGKIYIAAGGGSSAHRTEYCRVHVYDTSSKTIVETKMCVESGEYQSIVYDSSSNSFVTLSLSNVWKLSAGTGYDNMNFQPATKNGDYYEISNASQLLWFKQQVYGGCADMKARLTTDIDMSGVSDPFSYYVYDYNIALAGKTTPTYPATFAFRGELDGQSHTISNYTISSTPYYYDGLLPYCIGANIHDLTVTGSIKLSQCDAMVQQADGSWKALSNQPVANVGLIGYMDGGTLTNVNAFITIDETVAGVSGTINKLVGGEGSTAVTTTNCLTEDPSKVTHAQNGGHKYENGFCVCSDATPSEDGYYQTPEFDTDGTTYLIANAGNLFWFAKNAAANACAKVTDDINMEEREFDGIGIHSSKRYAGTFDGQNHRIYNYTRTGNLAIGTGFFNSTNGATVRNFKLEGTVTFTNKDVNVFAVGTVLGYCTGTTVENVWSAVDMSLPGCTGGSSKMRLIGGFAGRFEGGSINLCRYSGTLDLRTSTIDTKIGGFLADFNQSTASSITNTLFDGKLLASTTTGTFGGLVGAVTTSGNKTLSNNLVVGEISLPSNFSGTVGPVSSSAASSFSTVSVVYYSNNIKKGDAIHTSGYVAVGTPIGTTSWEDIKTALNAGSTNWGINSQAYPVPGEQDAAQVTKYTITFNDWNGTQIQQTQVKEGAVITAPADPTREGYKFTGWNPAFTAGTTATKDETYTAQYSVNQYTITFDMNGATSAAISAITQDYGTAVTAPENPTRDGYDFSGWSPAVPSMMPAENMTCVAQWTAAGHYLNGFCLLGHTDCYEEPTKDANDYYLIDNGGKFFWFAKHVNASHPAYKAKLTSSTINLEDRAFPGFKVAYTGEIDGQGNTISGLNYSITTTGNKLGVFNELTGTLKNFTIEGTVSISGSANGAFVGSLVGYTNANSKIEDVTSSLTINISSGVRYSGGIVGAHGGGTINRCRYNGTMTVSGVAYNGMGGIIGEPRGGSISNSLFDGVIDCSACTNEPIAGGIIGGLDQYCANPTITNCFSYGVIKAHASKKTKIGAITGYVYSGKKITLTNVYHSTNKANNETTSAVGSAAGTVDGSSTDKTGSPDLANGTLKTALNNGYNNWKQGTSYPIPGAETTYTITFDTDDGSAVAAITQAAGTTVTAPANPSKTGYKFAGWVDASGNATTVPTTMPSQNITLKATWTINQYTITFNTVGGSEVEPITQDYNTEVTAPGNPTKTGYTFAGWDKTIPTTMPAENVTITATWTINQYTITFNTDGGTSIAAITQDYNTAVTVPTNPTKTGYTFAGWDKTIPTTMPAESITITANWTINQYTITFNTDGGSAVSPITQDYGTEVTAPSNPTKDNHDFVRWVDENGNEVSFPLNMPAKNMTLTAEWYIHAGYTNGFNNHFDTCLESEKYQTPEFDTDGVTYLIDNGGKLFWFANYVNSQANDAVIVNAKLTDNINLENRNFPTIGDSQTKYFGGVFDGQGFTIEGFSQTNSGSVYRSGMFSSLKGTNNTTGKAIVKNFTLKGTKSLGSTAAMHGVIVGDVWSYALVQDIVCEVDMTVSSSTSLVGGIAGTVQSNCTVDRCTYSGTLNSGSITAGIGGIVGTLRGGTISNCLVDGTLTNNTANPSLGGIAGTTSNNDNSKIENCLVHGTITLSSYSGSNAGVVFGTAAKTISISNTYYTTTNVDANLTAAIGNTTNVTGTPTDKTGSTNITDGTLKTSLNNGDNNWKQGTYYPVPGFDAELTITFDVTGGDAVDPIVKPAGTVVSLPSATKTGYTFAGWNTAQDGSGTKYAAGASFTISENVTLYAQWLRASFNVNYYVDGVLTYTDSFEYEATITPHAAPTKERYTFSGWSEIPATMPANDIRVDGTFTFTANAEGVYEIGNREDYVNFVNITKTNAAANAKVIDNIDLNNEPVEGIGSSTTPYTGTFDGQGHSITGYVRNITTGNCGGMFNYTNNATIKNFSLAGTMTVAGTGQQHGSVVGAAMGTTLIEDVHSSVNISITSTAAQVGGFVGRAASQINRCSYSGTVSTTTAYNKIGGFAGGLYGGTTTNCLFDGTLNVTTNDAGLVAGGFAASVIDALPNNIEKCLVHGTVTIPNKNAKCGIIIGLSNKDITLTNALYTTTNKTTDLSVLGFVEGGKQIGVARDVTGEEWSNVNVMLNPSEGTEGNWQIIAGKDYPQPRACTWSHTHTYHNGFCIAEDGNYEPATHATDGYYEVRNGGQLWWVATKINDGTLSKTTRIRLTENIDLEGDKHGSWPGICTLTKNAAGQDDWEGSAFQGIFNGMGFTINNYYQQINAGLVRRGLFNAVYNATIKDFNINGSIIISGNGAEAVMIGVAVGGSAGTSHIEDINSSVNITVNNGIIRDLGGVAGGLGDQNNNASVTMNRCRYNGTITLNDGTSNNRKAENVGGLVGELRSAVMKNCLFDGTITAASGANYSSIGGVVGKVGTNDNSEIHRTLCHGTIALPTGYDATTNANKCGIVVGSAEKTIYLYKCFHTTTNCSGLPFIGPHIIDKKATASDEEATVGSIIKVDQLLGTSTDKSEKLADLYSAAFRTTLGESNWHEADETTGNDYIYPYKDEEHFHKYKNGFCTSGDGEYEKPSIMGKNYKIYNAGQLFWFATKFNAGEIPQDATAEIMRDIDMEGDNYIYPGIGTSSRPFKGVFEGHGHKITSYYRDVINAEHTGLINDAVGATIKSFEIDGDVNFNLATIKSFHGTVLGYGINETGKDEKGQTVIVDEMLISDVFSFVDINCSNANTRVLGGIAGRSSGKLLRSRYGGTIKGVGGVASASGRQIGGILANAREAIDIEDCLFDGKIWITCQEADTMRVSGILASNEKNSGVNITIKNCLFNGCLQLQHTYEIGRDGTGVKSTQNGIIAGYWDSNLPKFVNNVYYLKTCDGMEGINIGNWEGKDQKPGSTMDTQEIEATKNQETGEYEITKEQWNVIFKALDEYKELMDENGNPIIGEDGKPLSERNGNWIYDVDNAGTGSNESLPVPGGHVCKHVNEDGTDAFDEFGYCTICGAARPLQKDEDGKYKLELVSDLASFRDMVNDGDINEGTVLNCILTADIDFAAFDGDFGEPIGNSNFNRYLYNFDGQGYKLLNVKITTDDEYVGFFGFAGDDSHDCYIHDFTITGEIEVPYDSKNNDDKPMYMGVVGKMYRGKVYNVHSELTMRNTNPTRAIVGGIVGCAETSEGNDGGNPLAVIIDKCSYTGTCHINAAGNFGGILGQTSCYTEVKNCTFAGNVHHTYKGSNNTTTFSGIVGYNEEPTFRGVKNCVVAGVLNTDKDRVYVPYGEEGNHKNAIVGEDKIITGMLSGDNHVKEESALTADQRTYLNQYANNYAWNVYQTLVPTNTAKAPTYVDQAKFINGEICAIMNNLDDNSSDIQNGHPWGQVLGYQKGSGLGINAEGNIVAGTHTEGSPAQRVPIPGWFADSVKTSVDTYKVEKRVYRVVKDASNNYTADYYYFDDTGDTTPYPSDAASMKVKRIDYSRSAKEYFQKSEEFFFVSVCLPFDLTKDMLPSENTVCYTFSKVVGNEVKLTDITPAESGSIAAGTPFIMKTDRLDNDWTLFKNADGTPNVSETGTPIALTPTNPSADNSKVGIYGAFNTTQLGEGFYKVKKDGSVLVKTTTKSHCYPYRVYLKLPVSASSAEYRLVFEESTDGIDHTRTDAARPVPTYDLYGRRVKDDAPGIVVRDGQKVMMR